MSRGNDRRGGTKEDYHVFLMINKYNFSLVYVMAYADSDSELGLGLRLVGARAGARGGFGGLGRARGKDSKF